MPKGLDIAGIATGGISSAIGAGLGIVGSAINDARQIKQQKKLQAMQIAGNKEMTEYNMQKQLEMWEKTGYVGQVDQMKRAGINPALLYGQGGGGGQTANVTPGNVTAGEAPKGGGEIMAGIGMGIQGAQLQLLQAQKENIEADTANKQADTTNKGVQTGDILAGIESKQAQTQLMKVQSELTNIQKQYESESMEDRLQAAYWTQRKLLDETTKICAEAGVAQATVEDKIQIVKNEVQKSAIEIGLAQAQKELTNAQTNVSKEQLAVQKATIEKITAEIKQGWTGLSIQQQNQDLQKWRSEMDKVFTGNTWYEKLFNKAIDKLSGNRAVIETNTQNYNNTRSTTHNWNE